jgi:hypothetical protein
MESDTTWIQHIALYDPLPNTTGLSALSETGVTNTAPTALGVPMGQWAIGGDSDTTATTVANGVSIPFFDGSAIRMADPEGNPISVITLVAASDARIKLYESGDIEIGEMLPIATNYVQLLGETTPGTLTFTLRATDPGGLYVEQEFTITVTA